MRFSIRLLLSGLFPLFCFSCTSIYNYGPGQLGTESFVLPSPGNQDSVRTGHYLSGRYFFNQGNGFNDDFQESSNFGNLAYHVGYSRRFFSASAGMGLFLGRYQVKKFTIDPGWKRFYGMHAAGQIALNIPFHEHLNWRVLGLSAGFSAEDGDLYAFRKRYRGTYGFSNFNESRFMKHIGLFSGIQARIKEWQIGLNSSFSLIFGDDQFLGVANSVGVSLGFGRLSGVYQFTAGTRQGENQSLGLVVRLR